MRSNGTTIYMSCNDEPSEDELHQLKDDMTQNNSTLRNQLQLEKPNNFYDSFQLLRLLRDQYFVTSLIRRIPNEVLTLIFSFLICDDSIQSLKVRHSLMLVCRRWNQLVAVTIKDFPACVFDLFSAIKPSKQTIEILKMDAFSLRLSITNERGFENPYFQFIRLRLQYARDLCITYNPLLHSGVNKRFSRIFPKLTTLKLRIPYHFSASECQLAIFMDANALIDVEIETEIHIRIPFPLLNIERYKECSLDPLRFVYGLQSASKLADLSYTIRNPTLIALSGLTRPTIHLKSMLHFEYVIYNGPANHVDFLRDLIFPNLQSLRIREEHEGIVDEIYDFFAASARINGSTVMESLTRLSIHSVPLIAGQLTRLLSRTPHLTYLECDDIPLYDLDRLRSPSPLHQAWALVSCLSILIIHDATNIRDIEELAVSRSTTVKLMFRDPVQRDRVALFLGSMSPPSKQVSYCLQELEHVIHAYSPSNDSELDASPESMIQRACNLMDDLDRLSFSSPQGMQLPLIHALNEFILLPSSVLALHSSAEEIRSHARSILTRFITLYQLRLPAPYEWVPLGRHCLLFDKQDAKIEWKPNHPTDYEILYGKYKAPTREEMFWSYEDCGRLNRGW
ncbi:hypothetical protein CVT24_012762 [Panaeolus cyanescens]|uniref:F-box domain-containing protein n=1 Tax=Panaeolus cyanescens TaxID=181874 RepID=A0A409YJC2_9AGAR|nr:hypothetical protein CVT24_012762 [Panaeolus cyanescens]